MPARTLALIAASLLAFTRADAQQVIPLWEAGAPGFESRRDEPEQHKDWWYKNIHNPSLTVFLPPAGKASGTAVIVAAGGGHRELVFNPEGVEPAQYLASLGITAFALKYRLFREPGSKYTLDNTAEDIRRAMRLVRARAGEWGVNPDRIGVMGWSAGGEVAALVAYPPVDGDPAAKDPVERVSARPDFQILIYPGPLGIPEQVPRDAPPLFLLGAADDEYVANVHVRSHAQVPRRRRPGRSAHLRAGQTRLQHGAEVEVREHQELAAAHGRVAAGSWLHAWCPVMQFDFPPASYAILLLIVAVSALGLHGRAEHHRAQPAQALPRGEARRVQHAHHLRLRARGFRPPAVQLADAVFLRPAARAHHRHAAFPRAVLHRAHRQQRWARSSSSGAIPTTPRWARRARSSGCCSRTSSTTRRRQLYLFFAIPIPAVVFAFGYLGYTIWSSKNPHGRINHDAHLDGATHRPGIRGHHRFRRVSRRRCARSMHGVC